MKYLGIALPVIAGILAMIWGLASWQWAIILVLTATGCFIYCAAIDKAETN